MCESSAFIMGKNNELIKIMDYIVNINPDGNKVYLTDLFGNQKIIDGAIKEMRLIDHKIILEENK
ncbi:CooT family nickel-binding protein [Terrisporobacter mayombei]|uniref:CooT family nickel-binding protein n=1 Tax=Terrisporobacter mayombei TaxID=1541 RepID=UPI00093D2847|nr:CooT family nickel-binding protein [Terrisporobacter mayombei]MCC3669280.1 CooT family nickel-binding protein [Terrisporobacter mayombei]